VRRGLAESRAQAQQLIEDGRVLVGGAPAAKVARQVAPSEPIVITGPPARFVSRGGEKLAAALARFALDVSGRRALDAGASTGGFTDCLLQAGAASVVAIDVGWGQLHPKLRNDPRVIVRERTNVRYLTLDQVGGIAFEVVVADLSFISLATVAPALVALAAPGASLVLLVKPQFEAGRAAVSKGKGVVREPEEWARALRRAAHALGQSGAVMIEGMVSPLRGAEGNVEFLIHACAGAPVGVPVVSPAGPVSEAGGDVRAVPHFDPDALAAAATRAALGPGAGAHDGGTPERGGEVLVPATPDGGSA
jgi:23S rRNA (cytidine1920-2'-O)/16S rRNA (cytidine1409-2'-O)-methyltransferase